MSPYTRFPIPVPARKYISLLVLVSLIVTSLPSSVYAQSFQEANMPHLPPPGVMVNLSPPFTPAHLQGITIHPRNALQFDFLIHKGNQLLDDGQKKVEYKKLVKYFLASLTIPDENQWVNLSPYEKDRIIEDNFGKTEMGRDLLAQDYMLKQITSSLIYPEENLGRRFWDKVYERAWKEFHSTNVPINSFNKVWIVPDQAIIYESGNTAYILKSHLKVMLEEDYLSLHKHSGKSFSIKASDKTHTIGSQVIREIILPELENEVNQGKNFANLRQMFSGMIIATWYKKALKESLLGKVYADKDKVTGVEQDPKTNEKIYQRYLKAFKKGVFNYIKEDVDKYTNEEIPRKYFSGGYGNKDLPKILQILTPDHPPTAAMIIALQADFAQASMDLTKVNLSAAMTRRELLGKFFRAGAIAAAVSKGLGGNLASAQTGLISEEESAVYLRQLRSPNQQIRLETLKKLILTEGPQILNMLEWHLISGFIYLIDSPRERFLEYRLMLSVIALRNNRRVDLDDEEFKNSINRIIDNRAPLESVKQNIKGSTLSGPSREAEDASVSEFRSQAYVNLFLHSSYPEDKVLATEGLTHLLETADLKDKPMIQRRLNILKQAPSKAQTAANPAMKVSTLVISLGLISSWLGLTACNLAPEIKPDNYKKLSAVRAPLKKNEIPAITHEGFMKFSKRYAQMHDASLDIDLRRRAAEEIWLDLHDLLRVHSDGINKNEFDALLSRIINILNNLGFDEEEKSLILKRIEDWSYYRNVPGGGVILHARTGINGKWSSLYFSPISDDGTGYQAELHLFPTKGIRWYRCFVLDSPSSKGAFSIVDAAVPSDQVPFSIQEQGQTALDYKEFVNQAMASKQMAPKDAAMNGGIDFNSANLPMIIKRNGQGVALPINQQDMAQLSRLQGFDADIIEIKTVFNVPILSELQHHLQSSASEGV